MPKNKGKMASQRTATAAAQPDQFVSGVSTIAETLKPHAKSLIGLGIAMIVVLAGYSVWSWQKGRKEAEATELYHRAILVHEVPIASDLDPAGTAAAPGDELRKLPARFPDKKARAEATLAVLDDLAAHDAGGAAREALLLRAGVLVELGRYDDAVSMYRAYAADATVPGLKLDAQEGLGYALENKAAGEKDPAARQKGLEAAMAAFAEMKATAEDADGQALSLFHQGRMLAVLGRRDEATKMLEAAKAKKPEPGLNQDIEMRLQALEAAPAAAPAPADAKAPADATAPADAKAPAPAEGN